MGSLPNLHELGKSSEEVETSAIQHSTGGCNNAHKVGPSNNASTSYYYGPGPALSQEERNRILHRHSSHCRGAKFRHNAQNKSVLDDYMLEQIATYSPLSSNRSTRNLAHSIRRRDSINSSIGANSVKRLIAVVRNTNSRLGPIYSRRILLKNLIVMCVTHILITAALLPFLALQGSMSVWLLPSSTTTVVDSPNTSSSFTVENLSPSPLTPETPQSSITINTGSHLLVLTHLLAALASLLSPYLIQRLPGGPHTVLLGAHLLLAVFFAAHVHSPSATSGAITSTTLTELDHSDTVLTATSSSSSVAAPIPAQHMYLLVVLGYGLVGLVLGPLAVARVTVLMTISSKIGQIFTSGGAAGCVTTSGGGCPVDEDEELRLQRRVVIVRRVARAFQAAHDFGLIFGSVLTALIITYTINLDSSSASSTPFSPPNLTLPTTNETLTLNNHTITNCLNLNPNAPNNNKSCPPVLDKLENSPSPTTTSVSSDNSLETFPQSNPSQMSPVIVITPLYDYNSFLDEIFAVDELGERVCGANACPSYYPLTAGTRSSNSGTSEVPAGVESSYQILPKTTGSALAGTFAILCALAALVSALGLDRIKVYVNQDLLERSAGRAALRAVRDSFADVRLQLAAPLAVFVGMEQAFMYADFSKSYVVCTLGIHRLNLVFLCMGLLQSIAACTLSMLMRTIKRYYVIAVGFAFHACLLMVQLVWKPLGDDPALFYVISAAWGVCNAVWEMLNFTLLTGLYLENWEVPFANSGFFRFLGMSISFSLHGFLCNWLKLYILGFAMLCAIVPLTCLEIRLENVRRVKHVTRL